MILSTFEADNPISQAYLIEGIRGSGKTVLMTTITNELGKDKDWIVIDLNSTQDFINDCAMRLIDSCKKIPDFFKQEFNIFIAGFGIGVNGNDTPQDNVSIIDNMLSSLKKHNKKVIITIDEVIHDDNIDYMTEEYAVDTNRIYGTGQSRVCMTTLILASEYPDLYAA